MSASSWFAVVVVVVVMHFICIYFSSAFHFVYLLILFFRFIVRFSWTSMCVILFFPFNCLLHWLICSVFLSYILYFIGNKIATHQCDQLASISVSYVRDLSFWSQYAMVHDSFFFIWWLDFMICVSLNMKFKCFVCVCTFWFALFASACVCSVFVCVFIVHMCEFECFAFICHISAWSSIHFNVNYWG